MFDFFRKHTRVLQFLLVLLIFPSFVFFGIQGYSGFSGGALSERPKLKCHCCGAAMVIVRRRIAPVASAGDAPGQANASREGQLR